MKILVLSDTHIPRSSHDLPGEVYDAIEGVDMILHAGDFVEKDVLDKLKGLRPTTAVYGNMDASLLHNILNQKEVIEVGGFKIGLIHGYGASADLIDTVKSEFKGVDAIVFGHSHASINIMKDGILFFNPGSPTDKVFANTNSYGILEVTDKKIEGKIITI
ncbi:MAG: metallophosphoesterase family protein [Candidatus Omnitrophica bacterium]|nr:metallophosphoesterase family protein [Candidatus Omnitrophota bacterium]